MTFAGSPERVEARLVAEAGYPFDPFRVSGFPRRLGSRASSRAVAQALAAPFACRAILERRRPDVVLGGGGYVAGPMVLAAWTKRIPAAVTEADAHVGLANRLASPFAKRVFLAYPGEKERGVGRPIPSSSRAVPRDEARRELGLPLDGKVLLVAGALAGARSLNEAAVEAFGEDGPAVLHLTGERDFELVRARVSRDDYVVLAVDGPLRRCARRGRPRARARGRIGLGARGGGAPRGARPLSARDRRPPDAERRALRACRRRGRRAGLGARDARRTSCARCSRTRRSSLRMREAMLGAARPDAAEEIAEELVQLARAARG